MKDKDTFKDWLQKNLEEDVKSIYFSEQSKRKVRTAILKEPKKENWWNRKWSLSWATAAAGILLLMFSIAFYTKTFFYVSQQEIAHYESKQRLIVHQGDIPFGAIQTAQLDQDSKGAGRP